MVRLTLIALIALGGTFGVSPGHRNFNCAEAYKSYLWELMRRELSIEQRVALHRWALRAYHACETGDLDDPKRLFERLDRWS